MRSVAMKAMVYDRYGSPDVLTLREVEKPAVADDGVLVRVRAASVNPVDWHTLTGTPYMVRVQAGLREPKSELLGVDFAGTVEDVGSSVNGFQPGDEVFGARSGALSEYVCARKVVVAKPANLTFEEAAAVPVAAVSALQGLRDKGGIQSGHRVLINGASGGVGTFAVQIAKALGAEVTAVCSTRNVETAQSLGADDVIDYTQEDFTRNGRRYDLMLDIAGNRSWTDCKRILEDNGTLVFVGGPKTNPLVGPLGHCVKVLVASLPGSRDVKIFIARVTKEDLTVLRELLEAGKIKPVIEKRYDLSDAPEALRYLGEGHARGKLVIIV
jgi:NADPH:quinone reductase-like Zn-dependent oxidoreductase